MKKLITTLILLLMFSSPSYAEWTKVSEGVDDRTYYVDFDRIRKVDGSVYYWILSSSSKPNSSGDFSSKMYMQGDCKLFQFKMLSTSNYTQPMGKGTPSLSGNIPNQEWQYPVPDSLIEIILNTVCNR